MNNNTKLRKGRNNENKKVFNAPLATSRPTANFYKAFAVFSGKFYVMHEKIFYLP